MASERAPGRPLGDGVEDQLPVAFDRLGELDEWVEVAALRPGEPADEQLRGGTGRRAPSLDDVQKVLTGRGNICPSVDVDEDRQRIPGAARTAALLSHDWEAVTIYGLRGWTGETVDFRYPVIAIAGENGSGRALC